jgi:hypothetical protein
VAVRQAVRPRLHLTDVANRLATAQHRHRSPGK